MAVFCTNCGAEIEAGAVFCTVCGTKAPAEAPTEKQAPAPATPMQGAPAQQPVSMGTFFGLQLLFAIPVIGWIVCIIMTFAPKNQTLKNYARAMLIWIVIGLLLALCLSLFLQWVGTMIPEWIEAVSNELPGAYPAGDSAGLGALADLMEAIEGLQGLEALPVE